MDGQRVLRSGRQTPENLLLQSEARLTLRTQSLCKAGARHILHISDYDSPMQHL